MSQKYYIVERNMFPFPTAAHNTRQWRTSKPPSSPITVGYLKKAQMMEQFEMDTLILQKGGFSGYSVSVGYLKDRKKARNLSTNSPFDEEFTHVPERRASGIPTMEFNLDLQDHLFPGAEGGILVKENGKKYFFQLDFKENRNSADVKAVKKFRRITLGINKVYISYNILM